ncbi:MAG: PspA/IM30 family protein [Fibrobacterales bacterium]
MNEGMTARVSRIISGSANRLITIIESAAPEVVMEESIREIDDAIYDVKSELGKVEASKHMISKRLIETNNKHNELSENISIALNENRDDLAEAAVSKQMDLEAQIPIMENAISENIEKEKELEGYILALNGKKSEMREELQSFKDAKKKDTLASVELSKLNLSEADIEQKVSKAEEAFNRVMGNSMGISTGRKTNLENDVKISELAELARSNRIKERLAEIKAKK